MSPRRGHPSHVATAMCVLSTVLLLTMAVTGLAQDRESLFGVRSRDLPQLEGASGKAHQAFVRGARAENKREYEAALEIYESFLGDSASTEKISMVQVPARRRSSEIIGTHSWRPVEDLAMSRILGLPPEARRSYFERTGARARMLWRFHEETGDRQALETLVRGYLLHPEGAAALTRKIDESIESGQLELALTLCARWLRFASDQAETKPSEIQLRRALAAFMVGHTELGRAALAKAGAAAQKFRAHWPDSSASEPRVRAGGVAADLPAARLPAALAARLAEVRAGGAGFELDLGAPMFVQPIDPSVRNFGRNAPSSTWRQEHLLHDALPVLDPVRADNLLIVQTPMTIHVLDLSWGGATALIWEPEDDRTFGVGRRDKRFRRISGRRGLGLARALRSSADSYLTHFPLPRLHEQPLRLSPVVVLERIDGGAPGAEQLVVYSVQGEDGVSRGYNYGGTLSKAVLARRAEAGVDLECLMVPEILWTAEQGTYLPSGRPLLRPGAGRLAIGMVREPTGVEATLEVVVADFDAATGKLVSRTAFSNPPTNRAWKQDREVISLPHPVSLGLTPEAKVVACDHRGTIACIDLHWLREAESSDAEEPVVTDDGEPEYLEFESPSGGTIRIRNPEFRGIRGAKPPANPTSRRGSIEWAVTYRSLHVDEDAFDSGLRGWGASAITVTGRGAVVAAPGDSNAAYFIGPDAAHISDASSVDLELPLTTMPREQAHFIFGVHQDGVLVQGAAAASFDPITGTGWRAAPRPRDEVLLSRGALAEGGWVFEPTADSVRILDASTGRLAGILHMPDARELEDSGAWMLQCRRIGVSLLGDLIVVVTDQGLMGWAF